MTLLKDKLTEKNCKSCTEKDRLREEQVEEMLNEVKGWKLSLERNRIYRQYQMKDFVSAAGFFNKVALLAQRDNHHPDISLTDYRDLKVELTTNTAKGLTENDFILAAKINELTFDPKE